MVESGFGGTGSHEAKDLGLGSVVGGANEKRLLNRDGSFNSRREGQSFLASLHAYHFLLTISWKRFIATVLAGYLVVNVLFALAYLACGPNAIGGNPPESFGGTFARAFFFSVETLGTIGYGNVYPVGLPANIIVTLESITGLLGLALGTGLLFARFSRPSAAIKFSERAVIAPYAGVTALMFRLTNARANQLIELEAKVLYSRIAGTGRRYDQLPLERTRVVFFPLSWTILHTINENSPLWGVTESELHDSDAEFLVLLSGVDETFSQIVHARTSYKPEEVLFDHRFVNIYNPISEDGTVSIDIRKLGETEPVPEDDDWGTKTIHSTGHFMSYAPPRQKK